MPEYFRGWYVKLQGAEESVAVIPARAELPLFGRSFTGALCCLLLDGREYRLASYLGARSELRGRVLTVRQGNLELSAELGEGGDRAARAGRLRRHGAARRRVPRGRGELPLFARRACAF